jgi:hypothetical protein
MIVAEHVEFKPIRQPAPDIAAEGGSEAEEAPVAAIF